MPAPERTASSPPTLPRPPPLPPIDPHSRQNGFRPPAFTMLTRHCSVCVARCVHLQFHAHRYSSRIAADSGEGETNHRLTRSSILGGGGEGGEVGGRRMLRPA